MSKEVIFLVIGAMLSVPLSILANVLTPRWQRWRAARSEIARDRSIFESTTAERAAEWLTAHPDRLAAMLMGEVLRGIAPTVVVLLSCIGTFAALTIASISGEFIFAYVAGAFVLVFIASSILLTWQLSRPIRMLRILMWRPEWRVSYLTWRLRDIDFLEDD